jgi:hypothetical protein
LGEDLLKRNLLIYFILIKKIFEKKKRKFFFFWGINSNNMEDECPLYRRGACDGTNCDLKHFSLCSTQGCSFKGCKNCLDIGKRFESNLGQMI